MFIIKPLSDVVLASMLVFSAPTAPGKPRPPVVYVRPAPQPILPILSLLAPAANAKPEPAEETPGYEDSYVRVKGLEGRLVVLPTLLTEFKLSVGEEIELDVMYQLLEYNNRMLQ